MAEQNFNFDDLLSQLKNDSVSNKRSKLKKLIMNSPEIEGSTIIALPILSNEKIYEKLDSVRELHSYNKFYKNGEDEVWMKLLDKSVYGKLSEEDEKLWMDTKDSLESLMDLKNDFYLCRFRKYTLFHVHILKFVNKKGIDDPDMTGEAVLIFPTHSIIRSLSDAVSMMSNNMGNNSWMPMVFSPVVKGREGALSIKFSRSQTTKGYDCSVSVIMNTQWQPIVDPKTDYTPTEELNIIGEFLSWQSGDSSLFNREVISEIKSTADKIIESIKPKSDEGEETEESKNEGPSDSSATPSEDSTEEQTKDKSNTPF